MAKAFIWIVLFFTCLGNSAAMCQTIHDQLVQGICLDLLKRNSFDSIQLTVKGLGVSPIDQSIVVFTPDSLSQSVLNFRRLKKSRQVEILSNHHFSIFPLADTLHIVDAQQVFFETGVANVGGHCFLFEKKNTSQMVGNVIFIEGVRFIRDMIIVSFSFPDNNNLIYSVSFVLPDKSARFYRSGLFDMPKSH